MDYLWLYLRAPFAAFRAFQAGVYRPTSPVMPPSAAMGLILNLAGIEMRDPTPGPTTLIREDIPRLCLAVGTVTPGEVATLYQQLHSYPVGNSGKDLKPRTKGAKYWITPVRRELMANFEVMVGVRDPDPVLVERLQRGLTGTLDYPRYGLPFAGDNNFLFDRIEVLSAPHPAHWYGRLEPGDPPRRGSCRLTVGINRANNSKTTSFLYAPIEEPTTEPPESSWTWTPGEPR